MGGPGKPKVDLHVPTAFPRGGREQGQDLIEQRGDRPDARPELRLVAPHHEDRSIDLVGGHALRTHRRTEPASQSGSLRGRQHRPRGDRPHPILEVLAPGGSHPGCDREIKRALTLTPPEADRDTGSLTDRIGGDLQCRFWLHDPYELAPELGSLFEGDERSTKSIPLSG